MTVRKRERGRREERERVCMRKREGEKNTYTIQSIHILSHLHILSIKRSLLAL